MPDKSGPYLLLEIKRAPDDCDGIGLQVTAELAFVAVHSDELLELSTSVYDTMVRTEGELEQLSDRPSDDALR